MARWALGEKKVKRLAERTGLPVVAASTRGGIDHAVDLYLTTGRVMRLYKDGTSEDLASWDFENWQKKQNND